MNAAVVRRFTERYSTRFDVNVICARDVFEFHKLHRVEDLCRHDPEPVTPERFAIGVHFESPLSVNAVSRLEDLAAVNVFGMTGTIDDDCGHLSINHQLDLLWGHIVRHANALVLSCRATERSLLARYPDAGLLPRYTRLLPTRLDEYHAHTWREAALRDHVLILGNHHVYEASDEAASILASAFPNIQFVMLGGNTEVRGNVIAYRARDLDEEHVESLYSRASIIVVPFYASNFAFGLTRALAARKVVVARDIPVTREILATYPQVNGVFLYTANSDVVRTLQRAMNESASLVDDDGAEGWHEWVDGFASFCLRLVEEGDLFARLVGRIRNGDILRKASAYDRLEEESAETAAGGGGPDVGSVDSNAMRDWSDEDQCVIDSRGRRWKPARTVGELMALDGTEFVISAYVTVFRRLPDKEGLANYLRELRSGIYKLEVVSRLRKSAEGRRINAPISGYGVQRFRRRIATLVGAAK
jgi:hypothetical protein